MINPPQLPNVAAELPTFFRGPRVLKAFFNLVSICLFFEVLCTGTLYLQESEMLGSLSWESLVDDTAEVRSITGLSQHPFSNIFLTINQFSAPVVLF